MEDSQTISAYDSKADEYAQLTEQLPTDSILNHFLQHFKPGDLILDLGCGPAHAAAFMRDNGMSVDAVDASKEMVKLANHNFSIGARQATFDDIYQIDFYSGIWASFSLLHASKANFSSILIKLHRALKPEGILSLRMKLGTGENRDKLGRFYSYYSQKEICNYLQNTGFITNKIETGNAQGLAGELEPWIAITCIVVK